MKISQKLLVLSAVSISSLAFVTAIAFLIAAQIQASADYANKRSVPVLKAIYEVKVQQQAIEISLNRHLNDNSQSGRKKYEEDITRAREALKENLARIDGLVRSPQGRELYNTYRQAAEEYLRLGQQLIDKSNQGEQAGLPELQSQLAASAEKFSTALNGHLDNNQNNNLKFTAQSEASAKWLMTMLGLAALAAIILIGGFSFAIQRAIRKSLGSIQTTIARIEGGLDFTLHAPVLGRDEITEVSKALNRLQDTLRNTLSVVAQSAGTLQGAAGELASSSDQVAQASSEQSDAASTMAASLEELSVSITHVSERSSEARTHTLESGSLAAAGEKIIHKTASDIHEVSTIINRVASRIEELETSNAQISSVVSVIREVADQTNLLALNAAIEAARAGEQGRGFAVVADEVRKLAERTAAATVEISQTIHSIHEISADIINDTQQSVEAVNMSVEGTREASEAISRIGASSRHVVGMVEEIHQAIHEQSKACHTIAHKVEGIAQVSEENSAVAQNTQNAAHTLDKLAGELGSSVSRYKV